MEPYSRLPRYSSVEVQEICTLLAARTQDPSRSKLEMNQPSLSHDSPFGDPVAFSHSHRVISVEMPTTATQFDKLSFLYCTHKTNKFQQIKRE